MKNRSTDRAPAQQESTVRRRYSTPILKMYGSVSQLTKAGTSGSNEGSQGTGIMMSTSDRKLKKNIVRVGTHPMGFGLYLFDYKNDAHAKRGAPRHFGVIADEVEVVIPRAVVRHPDGYQMVDYAMIGINLADQ